MLSRREFLAGSASLLLTACAKPALLLPRPRKVRYAVTTQSTYWSQKQDFSSLKGVKSLKVPGLPGPDEGESFSILTVASDDGADVRRLKVPLKYHCAAAGPDDGVIYLMGNTRPSALVALDAATLEVIEVVSAGNGDERTFGGHGVQLPGTNLMAFTMNGFRKGHYDFISIRDARTLKEVESFSTFGFQVHEIRLSTDGKAFVCGHYGSYLGQGPYAGLGIYGGAGGYEDRKPKIVFPPSVTTVDARSGKRLAIVSDVHSGQEGHADSDDKRAIYLPNLPAAVTSRAKLESHPRFQEGDTTGEDHGEFAVTDHSVGICLAFDPKFREVIVPHRNGSAIYVTNSETRKQREIPYRETAPAWVRPQPDFLSGLAFHPDGRHYVLSTSDGFLAVERGTHRVNPGMSFPLPLRVHSHLCVFRA